MGTSGGGLNKLNDDFSFTRIKHDPENKSKKVKPGRPGIYLE